MFTANTNSAALVASIQNAIKALRDDLYNIQKLHAWSSGVSTAELVGLGLSTSDANALLSAINDANAIAQIYQSGQAPGTYPQVTGPYPYQASQVAILPGIA